MSHLFGDSTPFPYDLDYIALLRASIECSVHLLSAQHAIDTAYRQSEKLRNRHREDESDLTGVEDQVIDSLQDSFVHPKPAVVTLASRVAKETNVCVVEEVEELTTDTLGELTHHDKVIAAARQAAARSLEDLLMQYDFPDTQLCLTICSEGGEYQSRVAMNTCFGVNALCDVEVPEDHDWLLPRRINTLSPKVSLYLPRRKRWFRHGGTLASTRLDKLYISEVVLDQTHALLTLRQGHDSGHGFRFGIAYNQAPRVVVSALNNQGRLESNNAVTLGGSDNATAMRLMRRIGESTRELVQYRTSAASLVFENHPVSEVNEPAAIARRLIGSLAPVVREIARRSGTNGEYVVRRNLGLGRREEVYVTRDELFEKTQVLPPALQAEFGPLGILKELPVRETEPMAALN